MPYHPAEVLNIFFNLPLATLDAAIDAVAPMDLAERRPREGRSDSPERDATRIHDQLLQAHAAEGHPNFGAEMCLFMAHMPAERVCELAIDAARDLPESPIAKLTDEIRVIEEREGLGAGEYWPIGEGPADYRAVSETLAAEEECLQDRVMVEVFRRYRLEHLAQLYETDRVTFEISSEIGRRSMLPNSDSDLVNEAMEERLLQKYGSAALDLLRARLKAAGL